MVGNAAAAGVTMNAIKVDNITASAGSNNALWIGSGWGNIINLGNSVLIRGDGGYAGSVNNINVISTTTNATFYPAFFEATSGALAPRVDTGITYNPSTDALTAGQFIPSSSTAPATGLYLPATGTPAIATTSTERLRIDVNGNVGINQTSPTFRFDVTSNALATTANAQILHARFQNASANADYLEITSTRNQTGGPSWTTAGHRIQQKVDATWMAYIHFNGTSSNIGVGTTNNQGITFGTGGTSVGPNSVPEVMRITNNGDVGIGTNSPVSTAGYKVLTIAGGTGGALELMSGSTSILNISSTSSQATMQTKTTVPLLFGINSAEKMRIASDGNVAIGTTTTTNAALSVQVPSASASPNRSVYLTNGTQWLAHLPNASSGSFNPIVQSGDHALIWSNGTSDTGALTIGHWSSSSRGMRFDQYGNLSIGTSTVGYAINGRTSLTVNGTSQSLVGFLAGGSIKGYIYTDGTNMATSADAGGYTINGSTGLYFQTASAEKMRIDTNGNLTIGASVTSYGPVAIYRSNNTGQYPYITMDVGSTGYRHTSYNTAGVVRWQIGVNNTAETGSNAGSDFFMNTLSDAGAYIATPFRITRSNGRGFFSTELAITETRSDGGQLRIVSGNYGSFWRNDGSNLYLMFTNSGDQYGTWNNLRAFYVSVTTGAVNMSNGATVGSSLTSTGDITTYRSASVGTGALYLGNTGTRYLYYDGTNYNLNAAGLLVGGEVTAYSSDQRLKSNIVPITDAVGKVSALNGVTFDWNERAREFDFSPSKTRDVGVLAQDVERVLPEAVRLAPFDRKEDGSSKSGENYLTVQYEKLTALLIEAVKEQQATIEDQGKRLLALEELLKLG
jgi:hypothetical protein